MGTITRTAGLILSVFLSIGFVVLALITLLPAEASKPNLFGYYGVCSFAPKSTVILIAFAATSMIAAMRLRKRRESETAVMKLDRIFHSEGG